MDRAWVAKNCKFAKEDEEYPYWGGDLRKLYATSVVEKIKGGIEALDRGESSMFLEALKDASDSLKLAIKEAKAHAGFDRRLEESVGRQNPEEVTT